MSTMKTTRDVRGIGLSIPRPDGPEKVTGHVQYVADIKLQGLLHAKLLRSPHAHARIVKIDVSKARKLPGVRAVLTAADIPELKRKAPTRAHAVLAIDRAVFHGQPVAAVAADEPSIAEEALDLIEVKYEVLDAAVDPIHAMRVGAPPVADRGTEADTSEALAHSAVALAKGESKETKGVNVSQTSNVKSGDVAKERTVPVDEKAAAVAANAPTKCGTCGATITQPILRGQAEITCQYCGSVIRLS
jgi:CO/xanthine dehydrogenase Mo-binding subunit